MPVSMCVCVCVVVDFVIVVLFVTKVLFNVSKKKTVDQTMFNRNYSAKHTFAHEINDKIDNSYKLSFEYAYRVLNILIFKQTNHFEIPWLEIKMVRRSKYTQKNLQWQTTLRCCQ